MLRIIRNVFGRSYSNDINVLPTEGQTVVMTNVLEDQVSPMDSAVFARLKAKMLGYHFRDLNELHCRIITISSRFKESWYDDIYKK